MAIDNRLQIFDEQGNPVDYDILASDVKFLPDGKDLPTKLAEMEAHQGDGTVKGVKMNNGSPIEPDGDGVVDLGTVITQHQDISGKVDKNGTDSLMSAAEHTKLAGIEAGAEKNIIKGIKANGASTNLPVDQNGVVELPPAGSTISPATASPSMDGTASVGSSAKYAREDHVHPHDTSKANDNAVVKSISVNGTAQTKDSSGNVNIQVQAGDQVSVIQPDPADGTFIIRVGSNDYTINLNHTHEDMAKLVKCTEATLPQTLDNDKIYVQVDNLTTPTDIEALYIFGLEFTGGGATPGVPYLSSPGANISMGDTENGSVTKSIYVKGRFLTQDLSATLNGTGYTFGATQPTGVTRNSDTSLTIDADAAKAGVSIPVIYTGTAHNATATLTIISSSPDSIDVESTLVANSVTIENLAAVKLTGTQWLETDYHVNANTKVVMRCKFSPNSYTQTTSNKFYYLSCRQKESGDTSDFAFYAGIEQANQSGPYNFCVKYNPSSPSINTIARTSFETDDSTLEAYGSTVKFTPHGQSALTYNPNASIAAMTNPLCIGYYIMNGDPRIFNTFDLTIYELTISEGNETKRHYVPATIQGVPGLHDTVTGAFISSETSDELVVIQNS